jgi:hypothetical protein
MEFLMALQLGFRIEGDVMRFSVDSAFVRSAIERAIRQELRWSDLEAAAGAIEDHDHEWDADPAAWVRQQRRADARRAG